MPSDQEWQVSAFRLSEDEETAKQQHLPVVFVVVVAVEVLGLEVWQTAGSAVQPERPYQAARQETQNPPEPKQAAQGLLVLFVEAVAAA